MTTSPTGYGQTRPKSGMAIASLVVGLVGLLVLPIILGPLAIIFGFVAPKTAEGKRQGMAIAGIAIGAVDIVLFIVLVATAANYGVNF